ncbi:oocyte zinc finger protein XlCOF7.1-like [Hyperolius riggenbachi]|uniref:oocyte zinc finger protein XlCOF7.1-like n=1 Tax=Hyperolius riggenbachi TaxID=752182 RepID=UPI0035A2E173
MTTLLNMDEMQAHMTERILDFTLEIIYLLTGENHKIVRERSGELLMPRSHLHGPSPITEPLSDSPTPERIKKIVEVIYKIMELMTGEVPIRCQDVTICFSMEEWQYLEGHKELYKDAMMDQPLLTSPDVSSNKTPPERCTGPLYSSDCLQEDPTIPHHYQAKDLTDIKQEVKSEEEEADVICGWQCVEDADMMVTSELGIPVPDDQNMGSPSEGCLFSPPDDAAEDNGDTQCSPGGNPITGNTHYRLCHEERSPDPSNPEEFSSKISSVSSGADEIFSYPDFDKCFTGKSLLIHQSSYKEGRSFSCSECGKCFLRKVYLIRHQKIHTGRCSFSCSECGKRFL